MPQVVTSWDEPAADRSWQRADGSKKGMGFLGPLPFHDGRTSTEVSVGVELDGKETDVPALVPTLSKPEIDYILSGGSLKRNAGPVADGIVRKAQEHAVQRIKAGKPVFAGPDDYPAEAKDAPAVVSSWDEEPKGPGVLTKAADWFKKEAPAAASDVGNALLRMAGILPPVQALKGAEQAAGIAEFAVGVIPWALQVSAGVAGLETAAEAAIKGKPIVPGFYKGVEGAQALLHPVEELLAPQSPTGQAIAEGFGKAVEWGQENIPFSPKDTAERGYPGVAALESGALQVLGIPALLKGAISGVPLGGSLIAKHLAERARGEGAPVSGAPAAGVPTQAQSVAAQLRAIRPEAPEAPVARPPAGEGEAPAGQPSAQPAPAPFNPGADWQPIPPDAVLPPGLEIRMNMQTGLNEARLRPPAPAPAPEAKPIKDQIEGTKPEVVTEWGTVTGGDAVDLSTWFRKPVADVKDGALRLLARGDNATSKAAQAELDRRAAGRPPEPRAGVSPEPGAPPDQPAIPAPAGAPLFRPKPGDAPDVPRHAQKGLEVVEVPVAGLKLSEEVPQFKKAANSKGVVQPLGGKFDRIGVSPIQVWERMNGDLEVISGRHRWDLAQRSGEESMPAQIHREADGFTARQAARLDAELNIRDEQGSIADYANYFRESGITEEAAHAAGLLARAKGRSGFSIARDAAEEVYAAHSAGLLSDEAAHEIARAAPGNGSLQAVGLKLVNDGRPISLAVNTMRALSLMPQGEKKPEQGDIFGFDDSLIKQQLEVAKRAAAAQREIREQLAAVSGATKRPEVARKLGVDVKDPEAVMAKITELRAEAERMENWPLYPDLVAKFGGRRGEPAQNIPENIPPEAPAAERRQDSATRKAVAAMGEAELRAALLTDDMTGLANRRAYDESPKLPVQTLVDADSLKWVNDNMGHESGDTMLRLIAQAIKDETPNGYRLSGDEFVIQAETPAAAEAIMAKVRARLADATLKVERPDGTTGELKGLGVSHGKGSTIAEADAGLREHKGARQREGTRADRGHRPPGATETAAKGREDRGGPATEKAPVDDAVQRAIDQREARFEYFKASKAIAEAKTGQPFTQTLIRGEGAPESPYNVLGPGEPILGPGRYTTSERAFAEEFGPDISEVQTRLENPLVISSDAQWRELTRKRAGWEFPNPLRMPGPGSKAKTSEEIMRLRKILEEDGHDGVVVNVPKSEAEGKTLQKVFGESQVVEFNPPGVDTATKSMFQKRAPYNADQQDIFAKPKTKPTEKAGVIERIPGEDGMEAVLVKTDKGAYRVALRDIEADQTAGFSRDYATIGEARAAGGSLLAGKKPALELKGETEAEIRAREAADRLKRGKEDEDLAARNRAAREERERKEIAERSKGASFELTSTEAVDKKAQAEADARRAEADLAGQKSLFEPGGKYEALAPDLAKIKTKLVTFSSGLSRPKEISASAAAGMRSVGIGVDASSLSSKAIEALADEALRQTQVFVDSGAFGNFRRTLKSGAPAPETNFDLILERYDRLLQKISEKNEVEDTFPPVRMVMPDVVGDQAATIRLIQKYKRWISSSMLSRQEAPIIPLQKGELDLASMYRKVRDVLGSDNFIAGIPANEKAVSPKEFQAFVRDARPEQIHLLGAGSEAKVRPYLQAIAIEGLADHVKSISADASPIRNKIIEKGQPEAERLYKVALNTTSLAEFAKEVGIPIDEARFWFDAATRGKEYAKQAQKQQGSLFEPGARYSAGGARAQLEAKAADLKRRFDEANVKGTPDRGRLYSSWQKTLRQIDELGGEHQVRQQIRGQDPAGQLDLFSQVPVKGTSAKTFEKIVVEPEKVGERKISVDRVNHAGHAAAVFQDLTRSPMEKFQVLGLDENNKPIAFFDMFAGTVTQTSVYPREVWTAIYQTPGVKSVWIAHQHPSGLAEPSHADMVLTKSLQAALKPDIGVELKGHLIITKDHTVDIGPDGNERVRVDVAVGMQPRTIPIMERVIKSEEGVREILQSSQVVRDFFRKLDPGEAGLLFLDAQNKAVSWWPMSVPEMAKLRTGDVNTGMAALMKKVGRTNAAAAIAYSPEPTNLSFDLALRNVGSALQLADVKMLDAITPEAVGTSGKGAQPGTLQAPGRLESHAELGKPMTLPNLVDFNMGITPKAMAQGVGAVADLARAAGRRAAETKMGAAAADWGAAVAEDLQTKIAPMAAGTEAARAITKDFANADRLSRWQWTRFDDILKKNFTKEQRQKMWDAAEDENLVRMEKIPEGERAGRGLDRLTKEERATMDTLQEYGDKLLERARDVGLFRGEGVEYWAPRIVTMVGQDGTFSAPRAKPEGPRSGPGKSPYTNPVGGNITTNAASLKHRKYATVGETEAAAKTKFGEGAQVVRDIRTMPMAMARIERAIAGKELINAIKEFGKETGQELVGDAAKEGYFTLDHPAFKVYRYRPDIKFTEAWDKNMWQAMNDFASAIGVKHERLLSMRGRTWGDASRSGKVRTRFGGPETVFTHEIGHQLDFKYGLVERFFGGDRPKSDFILNRQITKAEREGNTGLAEKYRKQMAINAEMRDLADLRFEGMETSEYYKKYVRKGTEKMANMVHAYVHAPEKFSAVAPTAYAEFKGFLSQHPELAQLDTIKPSLTLGSGGFVKRPPGEDFDVFPVYVSKEFEGPLKSVMSDIPGKLYSSMMDLKGRTMSVIMYSPLIHNGVEWGRALPLMPGRILTFKTYFDGNVAKHDTQIMSQAIKEGLVPIGHRFYMQDITGIMESPELQPGRSWTAKIAGGATGLVNKKAGEAVKRGIDTAGDFWHNTLLWDRVGDLQMGIYTTMKTDLIKKGMDPETAGRVAAHFGNRYAGALPNESMSNMARKVANFAFFSRTFTFGNLGVMKDMMTGLPRDVQAQIARDAGEVARFAAKGVAQKVAIKAFGTDIALMYAANSALQSGFDHMKRDKSLDEIEREYLDRFDRMMQHAKESPSDLLKPFAMLESLTPLSENEPGKEYRVLYNYDATGTAIYVRLPMGKIGEEFLHWGTSPLDILKRKEGTIMRPLIQTLTNDRGFGRRVYDPDAPGFKGAARAMGSIAWNMLSNQFPTDSINSAIEIFKGRSDETDALKVIGPLFGVTFSKGAPGGPEVGMLFTAERRHRNEVSEAMPEIKKLIKGDEMDAAIERMYEAHFTPQEIKATILYATNPRARLNPRRMLKFFQVAPPEDREKLERMQEGQQ